MIVIHHNPACGTSRDVLAIIRASGTEPVGIDHMIHGWTRPQLLALFAAAGLTPRQAMRTGKTPAAELGLLEEEVADEQILDAMLTHPVLVNRPIVASPKVGAPLPRLRRCCRCWTGCRRVRSLREMGR